MKKIIGEGEVMPKGYGFSYMLWDRRAHVAYPFPINHLVGFFRKLWFMVRDADFSQKEREALQRVSEEWREVEKGRRDLLKAMNEFREIKGLL